jgi:hypothetical protein
MILVYGLSVYCHAYFWVGLSLRGFLCHENKTRRGLGNGSRCMKATKYVLSVRTSQSLLTEVITSTKLLVS